MGMPLPTKVLANFIGSSRAKMTFLSHPELRSEGQVFVYYIHGLVI